MTRSQDCCKVAVTKYCVRSVGLSVELSQKFAMFWHSLDLNIMNLKNNVSLRFCGMKFLII